MFWSRLIIAGAFALALTALTLVPPDSPGSSSASGRSDAGGEADGDQETAVDPSPSELDPTTVPSDPTTAPSTDPTTAAPTTCTPATPLVDPLATPEAVCLAAKLDSWVASGQYGLGQQLNVSNQTWYEPLEQIAPEVPAVVGFDVEELVEAQDYAFLPAPLESLMQLASDGVVLTASWHTPNPSGGTSSSDRSWQDLPALFDPNSGPYQRFWSHYDDVLELLERIQTGDDGSYAPAAVLFRPLHEANGDWFWWAQGVDPTLYKQLYAELQQRAWDAGVHNIVWGWSANAVNGSHIADPLTILPDRVDLVGIDSYEQMAGRGEQNQQLDLNGLAELAQRVPRAAVTEAGPHGSKNGAWDPAVVAPSALAVGVRPAYVMMWFDDGNASDGYTGKKQLGSLTLGPSLLASCPGGVCPLPSG